MGMSNFEGKGRRAINYRDAVQKLLNRSRFRLGFGLRWVQGPCIRWAPDRHMAKAQFLGERTCPGMSDYTFFGELFKNG